MLQLIIDIFLFLIYVSAFLYLLAVTWKIWVIYVQTKNNKNLKYVLLEIKLPREINKSPEATELWIRSLIEGGSLGSWYKEKWLGNLPAIASLEIASLEGVIHFYVRIQTKFQERVEAAIYSQYPNVEIIEAEDYTKLFSYDRKSPGNLWGCMWQLAKGGSGQLVDKDKKTLQEVKYSGDMYPIKTYKDWGMDKDPKEMFKHDPLTYFLETIASAGKDEYWCHQILIRDAGKWNKIYSLKDAKDDEKTVAEGKELKNLVTIEIDKFKKKWALKTPKDEILDEYGYVKQKKGIDGKDVDVTYADTILVSKDISEQERDAEAKEAIKAIQAKMAKPQVIAMMRTIIVGKDGSKNIGGHITTHMSLMKPFNEDGYNTFRPADGSVADPYDFPWQDVMKRRLPWRKDELYGGYVGRAGLISIVKGKISDATELFLDLYFFNLPDDVRDITEKVIKIFLHPFTPYGLNGFILNTEELATLYHFPGEVAATPGIPRIDSVKGAAPANVPK